MNNLLDDIIDVFGKNKKYLIYVVLVYIIIVIAIIAYIWWPKEKDYLEYENVNIEVKQQELAQTYINDISMLFRLGDKQSVKDLISNEYVNYTGKSKDKLIEELDKKGFFSLYAEMKGIDLYVDENTYVYTTTIYYGNNSRKINIIEEYPYEYSIVFDDFYRYNEINKSSTSQDIKFTINDIYRNLRYIEINMKIENLNSTYVRFDFNSSTCIQAVLEDGKTYSISNLVSTEEYTDIESNTTISKTLVFEIPAQLQNNIQYVVFNGVKLQFSKANIKIQI